RRQGQRDVGRDIEGERAVAVRGGMLTRGAHHHRRSRHRGAIDVEDMAGDRCPLADGGASRGTVRCRPDLATGEGGDCEVGPGDVPTINHWKICFSDYFYCG